jgi:hypothetical protein
MVCCYPQRRPRHTVELCEHLFVTSQGSAYSRFRRALDNRSAGLALASAAELRSVSLTDALELCLLLCEREPGRYERAALRWHGRYCREVDGVSLDEGQAVLALLAALRGSRRSAVAVSLAELFDRRQLHQASEVLIRWAVDKG